MRFCACSHFVTGLLWAASGAFAVESEGKIAEGASSIQSEHSSLVPLDADVLLENAYFQCTWLHPAALPVDGPQQLALAPPPLRLQAGPDPEFEDTRQTETQPIPRQPPVEKNKTASIVRDGGVKETERSNVASSQDGARLLFANPEAKKPESILSGDKFSFMKNDCADEKFVAIELSQRVKLTSLEVTMIELYSSRARTIDLYSTLTKPVKAAKSPWLAGDWTYFATVKAENKKGDHVFSLAAQDFTRYLLLHFTSHYGTETFCTINNVRIFGVTETEDLEAQLEALQDLSADTAATAAAHFVATAEDVDTLNDLSDSSHSGMEAYLDVTPDRVTPLALDSDESDTVDPAYDDHTADEQEPNHPVIRNRESFAHTVVGDDLDPSDHGQLAEHATPIVAPYGASAALEAEDPAPKYHSPEAYSEHTANARTVERKHTVHQPSVESHVGPPRPGEPQNEAQAGDHHVGSGLNARGDSETVRAPSVHDAANIGTVNGGASWDSGHREDTTVPSAGDSNVQAGDADTQTQADAPQHHNPQGQHAPAHSIPPHPAPSKPKAPPADRKRLLIGDGTVTGMYQTDVPPDSIPQHQTSTGTSTAPTGVHSTPMGTSGPVPGADAQASSHPAGSISGRGTGSTESTGTPKIKSQSPNPSAYEPGSTKRTPNTQSSSPSQRVQQPQPPVTSDSPSPTATPEARAPVAPPTNRTSGPTAPNGQATQQRSQPAAGAGHSNTNASLNTNVNTTASVGGSGGSSAPGEGSSASTSKSGSVYDTIKKELLSLRVETSTLAKSVAATASVSNVTNLTKRHDAAIKRLSAVSTRVQELEVVLAGLQLASAEAALAQQRLQREVSLAIVLSVVAILLVLLLWRSRQRAADQGIPSIPWSRQSPPPHARPNTGPVAFYSRSKSHADLVHQQLRVTPSHSSQSLPSTAAHHSHGSCANAYSRSGGAPNSHPQTHPSLIQRTPSGTVVAAHVRSASPTKCDSKCCLPRTSEHDSEYHDGERASEYHDPLQDHTACTTLQNGSGAPCSRHCGSSRDVCTCNPAVWNSDSAFNSLTTVPPNMKRSFGSSSIHSIRTNEGLTRRNRSRTSSEIASPDATSPTCALQAQSSAWAQSSQPMQAAHSHHPITYTSALGSVAQRRKAAGALTRASAPASGYKAPPNAPMQPLQATAFNAVRSTDSGAGSASGARRSGSVVSEQGSCTLGDSAELEDLLPAPTFAHLASKSLLVADGEPGSHIGATAVTHQDSQSLPLSDSRALFFSDDAAGSSSIIPGHNSDAVHSGLHGKQTKHDDSSCSLVSSPHSHRSRGASMPNSAELPSLSHELNSGKGADAGPPSHAAPLIRSLSPSCTPGIPVGLTGRSDDTGPASASTSISTSPLQRRSAGKTVPSWKSTTTAQFGSLVNMQSVPHSDGSIMSDAWGGSDAGSLRCSRTQSVHVLRSNPSVGSLPGYES